MSNLFTVNHAEAGGTFEALPIQKYECVISQAKLGKSKGEKTAGCDQIELQLTIREDIDQPGKKRKFFDTIIFAANLGWKVQQFFKACNFPDGTQFGSVEEIARAVAYRTIGVQNKHEAWQGKDKDKVDFYFVSEHPLAAGAAEGMSGGFDPFAGGDGGAATDHGDDDVPF